MSIFFGELVLGAAYAGDTAISQIYQGETPLLPGGPSYTSNILDIFGDGSCTAYYPLDGNAMDVSGNYSGIWSGNEKYVIGKYLLAANTETDKYIKTGLRAPNSTGYSFSAYVKFINDFSGDDTWIVADSDDQGNFYTMRMSIGFRDNNFLIVMGDGSSHFSDNSINAEFLLDGNFHHIAMVYSETSIRCYVDGSVVADLTSTIACSAGENDIWLGRRQDVNAYNKPVIIDQLRFFNRALTTSEVTKLMNEKPPITASQTDPFNDGSEIAFFKFENNVNDAYGNHGSWSGTEKYGIGIWGSCVKKNNTSEDTRITLSSPIEFSSSDDFTISLFAKFFDDGEYNSLLLGGVDRGSNKSYIWISAHSGRMQIAGIDEAHSRLLVAIDWSRMHHYAIVVRRGSGVDFYIDGIKMGTGDSLPPAFKIETLLGAYHENYRKGFNGEIDQLRIFNRALESNEVLHLYQEQPKLYIDASMPDPFGDSKEVAFYRFENNILDEHGNYTGSWSGNEQYADGLFGKGILLDGASYIKNIGNPIPSSGSFSIVFYVNSTASAAQMILHRGRVYSDGNEYGFSCLINSDNDFVRFDRCVGSSTLYNVQCSYNNGGKFVMIYNAESGTGEIYSESEYASSNFGTAPISYHSTYDTGNVDIGVHDLPGVTKDQYMRGVIDHIRIFNRALSRREVQMIYNEHL